MRLNLRLLKISEVEASLEKKAINIWKIDQTLELNQKKEMILWEKSLLMRDYCLLFLFNPKFETKRTFFG
jgi:hypothetical protein